MGFQHMHPVIRRAAQRKGGRWKLKKGFGTNPELARKAGSKGGTNKKLNAEKGITTTKVADSAPDSVIERIISE